MRAIKIDGKPVKRITINGGLWWEYTEPERLYIEEMLVSEVQGRFVDEVNEFDINRYNINGLLVSALERKLVSNIEQCEVSG